MDGGQLGTVLVTGADGFIGGFVVAALQTAGWQVVRGVRCAVPPAADARTCDFSRLAWPRLEGARLLAGVDAVVNVAGILRERARAGQDFDALHHDGPLALAQACVAQGVRRFVQISALGDARDGAFMASKHRFDRALLALASADFQPIVLRPSVVYSAQGAYGGTTLLRTLAAFPGVVPLPGHGHWPLQPVAAEDLAQVVVQALARPAVVGCFEVAGPEVLPLAHYQQQWRVWLRLPPRPALRLPTWVIAVATGLGDLLGRGPMTLATWRMLQRGSVAAADAADTLAAALDCRPRPLSAVLAAHPSQMQDRWAAQLGWAGPLLTLGIVLLFLLSAWAGLCTPAAQIEALAAASPLAQLAPVALARGGGVADLLLALALMFAPRPRPVLAGMLLLVLGYTLCFGTLLPAAWLDPLGGLAKNLVVLPALLVAWVLAERR